MSIFNFKNGFLTFDTQILSNFFIFLNYLPCVAFSILYRRFLVKRVKSLLVTFLAGVPPSFPSRFIFWAQRRTVVRTTLSWEAWLLVSSLLQTHLGSMRFGDGQEVPSGALFLFLLQPSAVSWNIQGGKRESFLPQMLR